NGGTLNSVPLLSPRLGEDVTPNYTGERLGGYMGMPMRPGLGPPVRGGTGTVRRPGSPAPPRAIGHGGGGPARSRGGARVGRVVCVPDEQPRARPVAHGATRSDLELRSLRDRRGVMFTRQA